MNWSGRTEAFFALICVLVTVALYAAGAASRDKVAMGEFRRHADDAVQVLRTRLQSYMQTVQGTAAFMHASRGVSSAQFDDYVARLDNDRLLPGLGGIGFIQSVQTGALESYLREVRADGEPGYELRNLTPGDTHYLVRYIHPRSKHQGALGLDAAFEPVRRVALEAARDSGAARLTPPIDLVTYDGEAAGFLLALPYAGRVGAGQPRPPADAQPFAGWVYTLFIAENLMADLTDSLGESYSYRLYDGSIADPARLILEDGQADGPTGAFEASYQIEQLGRPWTIIFSSTARFDRTFHSFWPLITLLGGIVLTALILFLLRARRRRSEALAEVALLRERQVVAREAENRAIVENDVTSVFVLDAQGHIVFANRAALATFGYSEDALTGLPFEKLVRRIPPGRSMAGCNAMGHPKGGALLSLDLQMNEWTTVDGAPRVTALVRDVTPQIVAQSELKRTKTLYDMALNSAQIGVFELDIKAMTTEVSETWCDIMGCPSNCNDGDTEAMFQARVHPEDLPLLRAVEADCASGLTEAATAEYRVRFGEDEWRWMRSNAVVVERSETGEALRMIGTQTDVTDLLQARSALEASEQMFRQVLSAVPVGMALMDEKGAFLNVNEAFCLLCGREEQSMVTGVRLADLLPPEDIKAVYRSVSKMNAGGPSQVYIEQHRIRHSGGDLRWGLVNITRFQDHRSGRNYYISQINDITDQKMVEQVKNQFVATVSHELRTPLTSIKGALELIKGAVGVELPRATARLIEIASANTDRLVGIVNDILDLEKISSGEVSFNFDDVCLADLVRAAVEEMAPFAQSHHSKLKADLPDGPLLIAADAARIRQVLANLVSNACKYSSAGSDVTIKAERLDGIAIIYVQNVGPGVPDAFRPRIFQAFSQADASDTRAKGGTGLGLNITRQIVGRHGGKVGFESVPGGVTVFWFTCPLAAERDAADAPRAIPGPAAPAGRMTVLHFEPDRDFAEIIASAMAPVAEIRHAATRDAAHDILCRVPLDALILDCTIADEEVADLLDVMALRQPGVRIIGLSADEDTARDPRLLINLIKSRTELGAIVTSVMRCLTRAS